MQGLFLISSLKLKVSENKGDINKFGALNSKGAKRGGKVNLKISNFFH